MEEKPTPEKIKQLFSSFLGDYDNENKINNDKETQCEVDPPVSSAARNIKQFFERVETFTALTWFAKPEAFSPLVCSRYGWKNIDTDMLQCVNCRAMLCGTLPKQVDAYSYKESCRKLKASLIEAHETACKWTTNPAPEKFYSLPFHSGKELLKGFLFRLASIKSLKVPHVSYKSTTEQILSKESLVNMIIQVQETTEVEPALLALCGWEYCESHQNVLQCSVCRRKIGLWNYCSPEETDTANTDSTNVSGENSNGVQNGNHCDSDLLKGDASFVNGKREHTGAIQAEDVEEVTSEPAKKRPKLEKQCFDPVAEHRYWCPWIQNDASDRSEQSAGNTSSPSISMATTEHAETTGTPAWLRVVKMLSHSDEKNQLHVQLKKSPELDSLRHLRRVLHDCTADK